LSPIAFFGCRRVEVREVTEAEMTKEKDFKRLVRERMAKTGESYTSARAQLRTAAITRESPPLGRTGETAALARALAELGVRDPRTGAAPSEALLFGIGGGIGIAYFVFEYRIGADQTWISLYLGGRINPYIQRQARGARPDAELLDVACARAGIPFEVQQSASPKAAEKQLRAAITEGGQAIVSVDEALLARAPAHLAGGSAVPVGVAIREGEPVLFDLARRPQPTTWPELARLRASVKSAKHRLLVLRPPAKPLDLRRAALDGIVETCRGLLEPPMKNFGLPALAKWADLVTDARDKKGWPTLFRQSARLGQALKWVAHWVVGPGSDGSFLRALYADFLLEAAALLGRDRLRAVAEQYRGLAGEWSQLAAAVMPRAIPQLEPIANLLAFKRCLLERHGGEAAAEELREIDEQLRAADEDLGHSAISDSDAHALFEQLRERLLHLHATESQAAQALAAATA
jgi:hypothetical protein